MGGYPAAMSVERKDGYLPITAYAPIGDGRALALVGMDGAVDWFAVPTIDQPPVCAAILDPQDGGSIHLRPTVPYEVERRYVEHTAVLETTFRTEQGTLRVTDALNRGNDGVLPWTELARRVEVEGADVPVEWSVAPGHRLATARPWTTTRGDTLLITVGTQQLAVVTDGLGKPVADGHRIHAKALLGEGTRGLLSVVGTDAEPVFAPEPANIQQRLDQTVQSWRSWCRQVRYDGPERDAVLRSAIVLKMLTLHSSGAIAAAPTTSLPEVVGGKRNFDYRFAWVRDMAFALDALSDLDLFEETHSAISWLLAAVSQTAPDVHVFYTLGGAPASASVEKETLLPGWEQTNPIQIGNSAAGQKQLGAYGDLFGAVWHYVEGGGRLNSATGEMLADLADNACDQWWQPDAGIWELGSYEHYTISKMSCWSALDRAVKLVERGEISPLHVQRWRTERDEIHAWVDEHCWSAEKQSYVMYAGTDELDAAVLLAARTGYLSGDDPRLHTTIDAVRAELTADGPLLFRFSRMKGKEGAFVACTFWLVQALAYAGRHDDARRLLEGGFAAANDVGIFSEEIDPTTRDLLGNVPQALSHLAAVVAATTVAATGRDRG